MSAMESVREQIASFLGLMPVGEAPPLRVLAREDEDGFAVSRVQYAAPDGESIEALAFEPAGTAIASVLALHQHNGQWTIGKSEIAGRTGDPLQAFGPALARRSVRVLAPDVLGFESRLAAADAGAWLAPPLTRPGGNAEGWLQNYNHMAHRLVRGELLMRKSLADAMAAISVLRGFGASIGAVGHSMGGVLTLFLAAVDERVAFACASGAACSYRHKLAHGTGLEMSLVIPGFARAFDLDDLLRCVAPRRLFVVSSDEDPYSADAVELVRDAKPAFEAGGELRHLRVPGPHALDRARFDAIVDWLAAGCR
jgi:dienelactone hydrolase